MRITDYKALDRASYELWIKSAELLRDVIRQNPDQIICLALEIVALSSQIAKADLTQVLNAPDEL